MKLTATILFVLLLVIPGLTTIASSLDPVPSGYMFSQSPPSNELRLQRDQNVEILFKVCGSDDDTGFQVLVGIGENSPIHNTNHDKPVYTPVIDGIQEIIYNIKWESKNVFCKIATAKVEGATVRNGTVLKSRLFPNQTTMSHTIGEVTIIIVEHQVTTTEPVTTEPATTATTIECSFTTNPVNKAKGVQSVTLVWTILSLLMITLTVM